MTPGQRVRVRPASPIARRRDVSTSDHGTVLCSYRVRGRSAERIDVRFGANSVLWGVAADEFETIEIATLPKAS